MGENVCHLPLFEYVLLSFYELLISLLLRLDQLIPHIRYGDNIAGMTRIRLDFAAQAADIEPDEIDLAVLIRAPATFQQQLEHNIAPRDLCSHYTPFVFEAHNTDAA